MKTLHKYWQTLKESFSWAFVGRVCVCLVCFILVALGALALWLMSGWGLLSADEIMFHLLSPKQGVSPQIVLSGISASVLPALAVAGLVGYLFFRLRKNPRKRRVLFAGCSVFLCLAFCFGVFFQVWVRLDIGGYLERRSASSTFIETHYAAPLPRKITFPVQKRNLVYILLESMESSYTDLEHGGSFAENYIPELTELALENTHFSGEAPLGGSTSLPGTGWTIAGMFSQSSGLPLLLPIEGNAMEEQDSFFPGLETLGDVLHENGYNQTLMLGSDATFGGRKLYYSTHGDYNIVDYPAAIKSGWIPEDYMVWWGYEDERLYSFAKKELQRLAAEPEPFNFTLLTADTHHPDGYLCRLCREDYDEPYANVVACSSRQATRFVQWIQQQDFYENTTIVILGDHLSMNASMMDAVPESQRSVYNAFVNPAVQTVHTTNRVFSDFDIFPTILASLGVNIQGDRLGLGVNLFSGQPTLLESYGLQNMDHELQAQSLFYEQLLTDIEIPQPKSE